MSRGLVFTGLCVITGAGGLVGGEYAIKSALSQDRAGIAAVGECERGERAIEMASEVITCAGVELSLVDNEDLSSGQVEVDWYETRQELKDAMDFDNSLITRVAFDGMGMAIGLGLTGVGAVLARSVSTNKPKPKKYKVLAS